MRWKPLALLVFVAATVSCGQPSRSARDVVPVQNSAPQLSHDIWALTVTPDGSTAVTFDGELRAWDLKTRKRLETYFDLGWKTLDRGGVALACTGDSKQLL